MHVGFSINQIIPDKDFPKGTRGDERYPMSRACTALKDGLLCVLSPKRDTRRLPMLDETCWSKWDGHLCLNLGNSGRESRWSMSGVVTVAFGSVERHLDGSKNSVWPLRHPREVDLVALKITGPTYSHGVSHHRDPLAGINLSHRIRPGAFDDSL